MTVDVVSGAGDKSMSAWIGAAIGACVTLIMGLCGWIWSLYESIRRHSVATKEDLQAYKVEVAQTYVSKEDYRDDIRYIKGRLDEIADAVSNKADRTP